MGLQDLPIDSGQAHRKVFESFGWTSRRSEKNHFVLTHPSHPGVFISIPDHRRIDRNLLRTEIRKAGLTVEQYCTQYEAIS